MSDTQSGPSGDVDIDAIYQEAAATPTDRSNLWRRVDALWAWMILLQRMGAELSEFLRVLDRFEVADIEEAPAGACRAVDEAFEVLARIQSRTPLPPEPEPRGKGDGNPGGESMTGGGAWPGYANNPQHTASTDEPGPMRGQVAWRFATGLAWYVQPVVEGGRVYATSPGIRNMMWCLDLESGEVRWKARRTRQGRAKPTSHTMLQSYTTPAAASTPQIVGDAIVVAEMGAQGWREGERGLLWIDKQTGALSERVAVGHADYRMGYARLAGNGRYLVHTEGIQRIEPNPPQAIGHNRVVCRRAADGEFAWDFPLGLTFGNPAIDDERAYVGTHDGVLFALSLKGEPVPEGFGSSDLQRVAWQFHAGAAINGTVALTDDHVVFGANDGAVYCLAKATGAMMWRAETSVDEPRAFQLFTTPTISDGRVYIGSAGRSLVCLDAATGERLWSVATSHWVRSRPVVRDGKAYVATLDGALHCLDVTGDEPTQAWRVELGEFGIFADLLEADGSILATDARLRLFCIEAENGEIKWRHHLLQHAAIEGREVQSDELACGGFHQSKPTAAGGMVFVGSPCRFVFGIDGATGEERWRYEMGAAISGGPAYAPTRDGHGSIFVGQQGGENDFYCLDATSGQARWKQALGWIWSSASYAQGKVYAPGVDGYLNCLDAESGHIVWRYRSGRAAHPEAPIDDGRVFFGSWDHFVYAFDCGTGALLWKFHTGGTPDSGAPIAHEGKLYVPMGGKRLCCLDAATGKVIWETRPKQGCMNASPALWNGRLFISTSVRSGAIPPASAIRCLDASTGEEIWSTPGGGITGPSVAGGHVYFASTSDPFFRCVDATGNRDGTTTVKWKAAMGDRVYESVPAICDAQAYVLSEDGYLYAFA